MPTAFLAITQTLVMKRKLDDFPSRTDSKRNRTSDSGQTRTLKPTATGSAPGGEPDVIGPKADIGT